MKFILTQELGRLLTWLRVLGLDALTGTAGSELVIKSLRENRVILTRSSKLSRFSGVRIEKLKAIL